MTKHANSLEKLLRRYKNVGHRFVFVSSRQIFARCNEEDHLLGQGLRGNIIAACLSQGSVDVRIDKANEI